MLLNNYLVFIIFLIIIDIVIKKWYTKNGENYKKDKATHASFSIARGCIFALGIYLTIMTIFVEIQLEKDVPSQGTSVYIYPDDEDKYNYFSSDLTSKYVGDPSEITEETYFDKINIDVQQKEISLGDFLKGALLAPFHINYDDFYLINEKYIANTGSVILDGNAIVQGDILSISGIKLRVNDSTEFIKDGDIVQAILIYDKEAVDDDIIEKYILVGGE